MGIPCTRSAWFPRIVATLAAALVATPLAGVAGGAVMWLALRLHQPEATLLLLLAFLFYGSFFGGLLAAPITLAVLPVATLLLHARRRLSRWLLPTLGLLAGAMRSFESSGGGLASGFTDMDLPMLLACACGGLLAGVLMAWMPPLLSPRGFSSLS